MTEAEEQQLIIRFADILREIPHRAHCARTKGTSHRCYCDIGDPALKAYNAFIDLVSLASK
jgi:hypothetical protein